MDAKGTPMRRCCLRDVRGDSQRWWEAGRGSGRRRQTSRGMYQFFIILFNWFVE